MNEHNIFLFKVDENIIVATSRPETMFGDVALAVNPEDFRYAKFVGKQAVNPLNGNTISIITDERVKLDFGTGKLHCFYE